MKMRLNRVRAAAAVLILLPGLALAWKPAEEGKPFTHAGSGYSVQFPVGWKYQKVPLSDECNATHEGSMLQSIAVDFRAHKSAFKALKQESSATMLPQDLAEKFVADSAKRGGLENVTTISNEPTELAGMPAFRMTFEYRLPVERGAVRYREVIVGVANANGLYLIDYSAPVIRYFDRDIDNFNNTLKTFSITPPVAAK